MSRLRDFLHSRSGRCIQLFFHLTMLALSVFLIVSISIDTFRGQIFYDVPSFVRLQTWICAFFMLDFFVEMLYAERKWHYVLTHFVFFLVSIPYIFIIYKLHLTLSPEAAYLVQYIPLVRGGYALAVVVSWFAYNRVTGIFITYVVTLLAMVYFGSLVFFSFEEPTNPDVTVYQDALWWACMDTTTVGSNIYAITPVGRVVSVVLAALGMMMFPIFTVYITSVIQNYRRNNKFPVLSRHLAQKNSFLQDAKIPDTPQQITSVHVTKEAGQT